MVQFEFSPGLAKLASLWETVGMANTEKATIKVICPICKTPHLFVRKDYEGKAFIPFECTKCGHKRGIPLTKEDAGQALPGS